MCSTTPLAKSRSWASDYYATMEKVLPECPGLKTIIAMDGGHPELAVL